MNPYFSYFVNFPFTEGKPKKKFFPFDHMQCQSCFKFCRELLLRDWKGIYDWSLNRIHDEHVKRDSEEEEDLFCTAKKQVERKKTIFELFQKARKVMLEKEEENLLLDEIDCNEEGIWEFSFLPAEVMEIVKENWCVGEKLFLKCLDFKPMEGAFIDSLIEADLSMSTLDLFSQIMKSREISCEFLSIFISKSILQCQMTNDHLVQQKMVKLLCTFVLPLSKSYTLDNDVIIELEAFCLQYSKIAAEAVTLYKHLRSNKSYS